MKKYYSYDGVTTDEIELVELTTEGICDVANAVVRKLRTPARWVGCHCSACGLEAIVEQNDTGGAWVFTPYCPWCGAKMKYEPSGDE